MDKMTFAMDSVKYQGKLYCAGDVLRSRVIAEFGTHVILGFALYESLYEVDLYVKVGRPYAYASCVGTTGPGVLLGCEEYTAPLRSLLTSCDHYVGHFTSGSAPVPYGEPLDYDNLSPAKRHQMTAD